MKLNTISDLLLVSLASLLLTACGGGGSYDNTWIMGQFKSTSAFKSKCDVPRVNVINPITGSFYSDIKGTELDEKNWLRSLTNEDYFWYDEVEDQNPSLFGSPKEYFDVLKTLATTSSGKLKDKFHFTASSEEYFKQSQSGAVYGYGAELILISNNVPRDLRISYTQPNSPAVTANLTRGTRILEIDGVDFVNSTGTANMNIVLAGLFPSTLGEEHVFKVQDPVTSAIRIITMLSSEIIIQPVQNVKTLTAAAGSKVGYMLFNEHIATAEQQLIDAVTKFKNDNIDDLVIDLRYNGGGALYIAAELASMIAGPDATNNRIVGRLNFNDKHSSLPIPFLTKTPSFSETPDVELPNLDLTRVFVITGSNTCSASEALMNSLRGVDLDVIQIGATTCGKPYGFSPEENCSTTYFSINFEIVNAKGFGGYSDGFTPVNEVGGIGEKISGCYEADDLLHQLGDISEKRLKMALHYQAFGQCAIISPKTARKNVEPVPSEGEMMKPSWSRNMTIH